jgi:tetratricopeptide (TPR) repeat protein
MIAELRPRWLQLVLALGLLLVLGPTPFPRALSERIQTAAAALKGSRGDQALDALEEALQLASDLPGLKLAAAQAALEADNPTLAMQYVDQARRSGAVGDEAGCLEAEILLAADQPDLAVELLSGSPAGCRPNPELLRQLSEEQLARGAWGPAERLLGQLVQAEPASARAHGQLGLLISRRDPPGALSNLRRAVELAPAEHALASQLIQAIEAGAALGGPARSLAQAGQVLAGAGEWGLAREALERSLDLDPESAGALALLGLALDQIGEDGSAQLQAAVELAPASAQVQLLLARHLRSLGRPEQALAALERAARLDPADPVVASDLASLYLALGDLRSAEAAYRYAAAVAPQDPLFWTLLARFSVEQEVDVASLGLPAARSALRLVPDDPRAVDLLAACHYLVGNLRVADRLLWQALSMDPGLASAHYHRGLVQLALGDLTSAVESLGRAQALDPSGRIGDLAGRSLANLPR